MTLPLAFRWPTAPLFWVVYLGVFLPEAGIALRAMTGPRAPLDRGSLAWILVANQLALLVGFALAFSPRWAMSAPRVAFGLGLGLMLCGSALRRVCVRILGSDFTGAVQVRPDQTVIERGPYRWVRHPSYSGAIALFGGVGVALGSWASALLLAVVAYAVYRRRARIEEEALLASIGEPYSAYRSRTGRFLPRFGGRRSM